MTQGQRIVTFDVPTVEATDRNPIIPVVVMDTKPDAVEVTTYLGGLVSPQDTLFTVTR